MVDICKVATASPDNNVDLEILKSVASTWLKSDTVAQEKLLRIVANSGVDKRKFVLPYNEILSLQGFSSRAKYFEAFGVDLLVESIKTVLEKNNQNPEDVGALVFTSCSVPLIPSIDAKAVLASKLSNTIARIPVYQYGCAGGVIGLALGARLASAGKAVIVASVELCSLVFQPNNHGGEQLVAAAIFGDGAAATIVSQLEGEAKILGFQSHLIENSHHLMGYDVFDDGFHLRLDRALPKTLIEVAPNVLSNFLKQYNLTEGDINYWLFHPGGLKILNFLRETFNISLEQCSWAYDVLREHGNLSSATILYVINAFFSDKVLKAGEKAVIMGIGPGLTIELILIEGN